MSRKDLCRVSVLVPTTAPPSSPPQCPLRYSLEQGATIRGRVEARGREWTHCKCGRRQKCGRRRRPVGSTLTLTQRQSRKGGGVRLGPGRGGEGVRVPWRSSEHRPENRGTSLTNVQIEKVVCGLGTYGP